MKKRLVLTLFALLMGWSAQAYDCKVDGICYNKISATEMEVTAATEKYSGSVIIPAEITWNGTTYRVTSIGGNAFWGCSGLTSVTIPENVTAIGDYAFYECSGLTSVTIPEGVTSIGSSAFRRCSGLTSVTIPEGVTSIGGIAFGDCSGLTSVQWNAKHCLDVSYYAPFGTSVSTITFGNEVEHIPGRLCDGCSGLTSVTIPNGVTSIGDYAFGGCSGLTSVTIPEGVTSIGSSAFRRCSGLTSVQWNAKHCADFSYYPFDTISTITFGNEVEHIPAYLCGSCSGLTSVTIPNGVTSIGDYAFWGCSGLTSVTIPESVTSIGSSVFSGCSGLTSVTIPEGVTSIGDYAFGGCSGLTSVTIPEGVTSIGYSAFRRCSGLTSVTIPEGVTSIGGIAFGGCSGLTLVQWNARHCADFSSCPFDTVSTITFGNEVEHIPAYLCDGCSGLTSVTIPESVTSIGYSAFRRCSGLTSVQWNAKHCADFSYYPFDTVSTIIFGNEVEHIPAYLCDGCSGLTSVTIPESVTSIGYSAFRRCSGLTSVTIPESVTSIGSSVFSGCSGLTSVTIPEGVTSIGSNAFSGCSGLTSVTIPESVTSIGSSVFSGCSGLSSVQWNAKHCADLSSCPFETSVSTITFGNEVEYIPANLCKGCSGLTSVTIPESVTSIGSNAFSGCGGLTSVISWAKTPPVIFYFFRYDTLYVPFGCKAAYSSASVWQTFSVIKELCTVALSINDETRGGVTGGGIYVLEEQAILEAIPNQGYQFVQWHDGNTDNPRTLTVTGDISFTAEFAPIYRVSVQVNDEIMGRVTGSGDYVLEEQATLEAVANEGYHFVQWHDGSTENPRTLTVTDNMTFTAEFAPIYRVSVQVNDEVMGRVTGGGDYVLDRQAILEAVPNQGYHFVQWHDGHTDNPRILTVTEAVTFTAEFAPNIYTVTLSVNDESFGRVTGGGDYAYGTPATLEAVPNEGYHFVKWSDDNTENPRTLTVTESVTFTAEFVPNIYAVTLSVNDEAMGRVTGGGDYAYGTPATLEAIANQGYQFVKWHDGSTENPRTLTVTESVTFTAEFAPNIYAVSVLVNDEAMGRVTGGGDYAYGTPVTLEAVPNQGYHFVQWHDGNTENPRTLTVTEDIELTAIFAKDETDPDDPTANEQAVSAAPFAYVQGRTAYLSDGLGEVEAFTTTGQRVYRGFDRAIALPHPGVYILRVVADGRWCKVAVR